jgi:hypothetical protein
MQNQPALDEVAALIRNLVEKHKDFIERMRRSVTPVALDSHFLIRSTESGFSYRWGETSKLVDQGGLVALEEATRQKFPDLSRYDRSFAEDVSFWAILAWHGFTSPSSYGAILEQYRGANSPYVATSSTWRMEAFLADLKQGASGDIGRRFADALSWVATLNCWLPRWKKRPYYGLLRNAHLLKTEFAGSFACLLRTALNPSAPDAVSWDAIGATAHETWHSIAPWKRLFGVGENIFFFVLRDIDFGQVRVEGAFKLDSRNAAFFRKHGLWSFGHLDGQQSNENAVAVLRLINDTIRSSDASWEYTVGDLNAAIYIAGERERPNKAMETDANKTRGSSPGR